MGTELTKNLGGRPLKFKSAKELERKGLAYFKECEEKKEPVTITGLALALDTNRHTLCNYEDRELFFHTIKKLKAMVEHAYEKQMWKANNPAAGVFALKQLGWTDRQDVNVNASLRPSSYTEEEEAELREIARLRALGETVKSITTGSGG